MKLLRIIFFFLLFSSCKSKNIEIIYESEIQIFTETDISPIHRLNAKFYNWEIPSLVVYSNVDYSLHFYDYKNKLEYKKINLKNLPNKKEVRAFQFINENFFIVSTQLNFQYYILNLEGEVETSFNLKPKNLKDFGNIAYGNFNDGANSIPIINFKNKNQLIVFQSYFAPYEYLKQYSSFYFLEYHINDSINIDLMHEFKFCNLSVSEVKTPYILDPRICNDNNHSYIGYSSNKDVFKLNKNQERIRLESCNLTIQESDFDTTKFDNIKYAVDFDLKTGNYENLIYDPYRNLFYQIASHSTTDIIKWENPYFSKIDCKEFSIQIYDNDFNFISETIFPKNTYQVNSLIPIPEGLLIDTGNENNPNYKTSVLTYHLFKII